MKTFLVINEFNDINEVYVRHYSIDKGWFIAQSLVSLGQKVYFLTTSPNYTFSDVHFMNDQSVDSTFFAGLDYLIIAREAMFFTIVQKMDVVKKYMQINISERRGPRIVVKSDYPLWFNHKENTRMFKQIFGVHRSKLKTWLADHLDYICAQNDTFKNLALQCGLPSRMIVVSKMGIQSTIPALTSSDNPYTTNYHYLVHNPAHLGKNKALAPLNFAHSNELPKPKYILVYTGRIKTNGGRILHNMKHIMQLLGDDYQLHIFPGSFIIPESTVNHSGKNKHSLALLQSQIFDSCNNVIIHYPYEHNDKYRYLYFAHCGLDFSDMRPSGSTACADHAKLLEYCESGLPVVCEENIHNVYLIKTGKNGIILPYLATDEEYAEAIRQVVVAPIDRQYCQKITCENENWNNIVIDLISAIS